MNGEPNVTIANSHDAPNGHGAPKGYTVKLSQTKISVFCRTETVSSCSKFQSYGKMEII